MNLLFCINREFLPLLVSCMRSIVRSGGAERYAVYILHTDLDGELEAALNRDFAGAAVFHLVEVPQSLFADFPETDRYPQEIYYRLAAPLLLPEELDRVLYLDVDTVVINPLTELYSLEFGHSLYAGCTHTREFLTRINRSRLKSDKAVSYINTGVLLMNLTALRETVSLEDIRAYTQERQHAFILPDQDILTALYGDRVALVDTMRYNLSDRVLGFHNAQEPRDRWDLDRVRRETSVIHYCGKNKPWKDGYAGQLGIFYRELMVSLRK